MLINLGQKIGSDKWGQVAASSPLSNGAAEQTHSCRSPGGVEGGAPERALCFAALLHPGSCKPLTRCKIVLFLCKTPCSLIVPAPLGAAFDVFFNFLFLQQEPEKMFISGSSAWGLLEVPCRAFAPQSIVLRGLVWPSLFLGKSFPQASY